MFLTGFYFIAGLFFLFTGAQLLVSSSSKLAVRFGVPAIFIGVTVIAFATSAPEAAVSLDAVINNQGNLAIGNVLGSNIANVLLILGISALITPIGIQKRIIRLDIPIMIFISVIVYLLALDRLLQPLDGIVLLALFIGFMIFQIYQAGKEKRAEINSDETRESPPVLRQTILLVTGLGLLVLGARLLVQSAIEIARIWGMSELIIGLTIVALGTSLPEIATSMLAAWKKEADLSVGNVIGSNIFNILFVLGLSALFSSEGVPVSVAALALDFPFMIAVSIVCLPIMFTGHRIARWEGGIFLIYYAAYLLYLFLDSTQHELLPLFNNVMLLFVVPVTIITLFISVFRYWGKVQASKQ
jgi:cation:H+ antiporter